MTRLMGKTYSKPLHVRATSPVALAFSSLPLTPYETFLKAWKTEPPLSHPEVWINTM